MKKILINESQLATIISMEKNGDAPAEVKKHYCINPDQVIIVKRFLDNGFKRGSIEEIGANGLPHVIPIVGVLSSKGEVLRNLYMDQLKDLLIDQFKKMFTDSDQREKFLGQVMKDWYDNKIGLYGSLSVNHL